MLEQPDEPARNTSIFLTGVPGAGKTSSVLATGALAPLVRAVFEGQLVKPETTIQTIQQVLDAGLRPEIIALHRWPQSDLRNTLQRFNEEGRGSSINTMAMIQGGTPDGLRAEQTHFVGAVQLQLLSHGMSPSLMLAGQSGPSVQAVVDRLGRDRSIRHTLALGDLPGVHQVCDRLGIELPDPSSLVGIEHLHFALDLLPASIARSARGRCCAAVFASKTPVFLDLPSRAWSRRCITRCAQRPITQMTRRLAPT